MYQNDVCVRKNKRKTTSIEGEEDMNYTETITFIVHRKMSVHFNLVHSTNPLIQLAHMNLTLNTNISVNFSKN